MVRAFRHPVLLSLRAGRACRLLRRRRVARWKRSDGASVSTELTLALCRCRTEQRNPGIPRIPSGRFDGGAANVSLVDTGPRVGLLHGGGFYCRACRRYQAARAPAQEPAAF